MSFRGRRALYWCGLLLIVFSLRQSGFSATPVTCISPEPAANAPLEYFVSIADHDRHLLHIAIRYHSTQNTVLQMPVWNALYQVRDFAQFVTELQARNSHGDPLPVSALDKTTWQIGSSDGCVVIEYNTFANTPGPFSAQANAEHVFLNWAQVLLYAPAQRAAPLMLSVTDVPRTWSLHDLGRFDEAAHNGTYQLMQPALYDALVDSPVEIGTSQMSTFESDGALYRIVVDADPADYNLPALQDAIRKVAHAEVDWMQDRPFDQYTFLYHFPHGPIGGGMEHSYGTAVTTPASRLKENALAPIGTTAHEFFHLWNVKRIRSQAMQPVDYEHEQYSRSLWFCEGVTSTASELMLVRAGLQDEHGYVAHVSELITDFESHSARKFQSPEASSLEAWMEGRPYYRRPERSVSYYTSGELLGILLDLRIRELTHGNKSLRDLFQLLNTQYAKQGRYYDDANGLQQAAESIAGAGIDEFFARYVRGTESIPYDNFFRWVGLKLEPFTVLGADAGFDASVNFTGLPEVVAVTPGRAVEAAGVRVGDTLVAIDDHEFLGDLSSDLAGHKPGETVAFRFTSRGRPIKVKVVLGAANLPAYSLVDVPKASDEQRAQRAVWVIGDDRNDGGRP
jgi:predicted metalloprotease with PDZ domain